MPFTPLAGLFRRLAAGEPDDELVRRFAGSRCDAAFAELVRRHGPAVFGVCRRALGDHHLAEDAFQAVFVVLARKAHTVRPPGAVGGWLYGVARKAAAEAVAMRRRKARESLPGALPERPAAAPEPDDTAAVVDAEIAGLPESLRAAVVLCEIEGVSRAAAAERLGVAPGTLSSRLARARKVLGERLRRRGDAPAAAGAVALPRALAKAAAGRADGQASGTVLELSNGVLRTMLLTTLKLAPARLTSVVLLCGGLAAGTVLGTPPEPPRAVAPPRPAAAVPRKASEPAPVPKRPLEWKEVFTLKHEGAVTAVAANREMIATAGGGDQPRVWGAADGKELDIVGRGVVVSIPANGLRFTADDDFLIVTFPPPAADKSGAVIRYVRRDGRLVPNAIAGFTVFAWSADLSTVVGRLLDKWKPNQVFLYDDPWAKGDNVLKPQAVVELPEGVAVVGADLSADGRRLAVAGDDGAVRVYDRATQAELHAVRLKKGQKVLAARLSDDGKRLAVLGGVGFAKVFDADGKEACELKGHDPSATAAAVAFSPDGKRVATAVGKVVRVFDAATGKPAGEITGHADDVTAVAFGPDGKRLVTGSADKTAKVWEVKE